MRKRIPREEVMHQLAILSDRLCIHHQQCQDIIKDSKVDANVRLQTIKLAIDISAAILKVHQEAPVILVNAKEISLFDLEGWHKKLLQEQKQQQQEHQQEEEIEAEYEIEDE
jgi:hypothetical protein